MAQNKDAIYGEGVLEILQDGFGFLRSSDANYLPGPDDIYVSPSQIKQNSLRTGDTVEGEMRAPRESERYFAITKIDKINFKNIEKTKQRINFDNLTPLYPDEKLKRKLKTRWKKILPIGYGPYYSIRKGQRALIVAPQEQANCNAPKYAHSITSNHPEVYLIVLLIDERPEK